MWKRRKAQPAKQEAAPYVDWVVQFREEQLQKEAEERANAETDAERVLALSKAAKNAQNYQNMVSNIMNMKHQTASNIIGNIR